MSKQHEPYDPRKQQSMPLDDLPADRLANALAMRRFLRHVPLRWFGVGSSSAQAAFDLHHAGVLRLERGRWRGLEVVRISEAQR